MTERADHAAIPISPSSEESMRYDFLVDTYDTERLKVLSVWSEFT